MAARSWPRLETGTTGHVMPVIQCASSCLNVCVCVCVCLRTHERSTVVLLPVFDKTAPHRFGTPIATLGPGSDHVIDCHPSAASSSHFFRVVDDHAPSGRVTIERWEIGESSLLKVEHHTSPPIVSRSFVKPAHQGASPTTFYFLWYLRA